MERFNKRGMLIIPNPVAGEQPLPENLIVIRELFCPRGHNLISSRAVFHSYPGILLRARKADRSEGLLALSPIYRDAARISLDINLEGGDILELFCPTCGVELPVHSPCTCGAHLIAFFNTPQGDFKNCLGICNRVDCRNAHIIMNDELIHLAEIEIPPERRT